MNLNNPQEFQKAMAELTPEIAIKTIDGVLMMQSFTRPEHAYFQKCLEVLRPQQVKEINETPTVIDLPTS